MALFSSSTFLDGGLTYLKTNGTKMLLLKAYTAGDSYATVVSNIIAEVAMASGDYVITGAAGADRVLTTAAGKSATASANSGAAPDLHIGFTNGTSEVIYVTDETSNQVVTAGNTVNYPQVTYTAKQPTAV